ncbi:MAG TPA: hypothetical protein VKZ53_09915 [Candidatus Angelobacter sp.]|nr:hypothetical protein [Candidatus Angelobacter sp.]
MAEASGVRQTVPARACSFFMVGATTKQYLALLAMLLTFNFEVQKCTAQEDASSQPQPSLQAREADKTKEADKSGEAENPGGLDVVQSQAQAQPSVTIPIGTQFPLISTKSISNSSAHPGDLVRAQLTAPVLVENTVAVPAGSFLQGKILKLTRNGTRAQIQIGSASLILPGGSVAAVSEPTTIVSDENTAWRVPSGGNRAAAFIAPTAGLALGALIGHAASSSQGTTVNGLTINPSRLKSTAIGGFVGLSIGGGVALALLLRSPGFFLDSGSPMELTLRQPLTLTQDQIAEAVQKAPLQPPLPKPARTCYTPDSPPTVIPGADGAPGTVIPGTPGTAYPCH